MLRIGKVAKIAFTALVIASSLCGSVAFAQGKADTFNRSTGAPPMGGYSSGMPISGNAALGKNDPVSRWFDAIDYAFYEHRVPKADTMIIARPFAGNPQRLQEWQAAVKTAAAKHRDYGKILRQMPVPPGLGQATQDFVSYKNLSADYWSDSAEYLEDWIRPRRPAVTREELEGQLKEMHDRALALKQQKESLEAIDNELRKQFDVRPRDDALMRYVAKQQPQR
jgi:hypothetical protein